MKLWGGVLIWTRGIKQRVFGGKGHGRGITCIEDLNDLLAGRTLLFDFTSIVVKILNLMALLLLR